MARLTVEQVKAWNTDNKNGFTFGISYFMFHSEKTVEKNIPIDETHVLTVHLMYREDYRTNTDYCDRTVLQIPTAHFSFSLIEGKMLISHGLGYWHDIGEARENKSYKVLQSLTAGLPDDNCLAIYKELTHTQVNQYA